MLIALTLASTIIIAFATYGPSAANLVTEAGALLLLVGWWRLVMQDREERRDLHALWIWARYGVLFLAAGFVLGLIQMA